MEEKKIFLMLCFTLLLLTISFAQESIYYIDLTIFLNNTVILNNIEITSGTLTHFPNTPTSYKMVILSKEGVLFSSYLPIVFSPILDLPTRSYPESKRVIIRAPYFPSATNILLLYENEVIFNISLKSSKCGNKVCENGEDWTNCCEDCGCPTGLRCVSNNCTCGNRVCEPEKGENYKTCKEDCLSGSKDSYCDGVIDGICDPDCNKEEDVDCGVVSYTSYVKILLFLIIFFILAVVFLRRYKVTKMIR